LPEACPGWQVWPIGTWDRRTEWSAQPDGAQGAVIMGKASADELLAAVREYEQDLDRHLDDAKALLASVPDSGIGRDSAAVLAALVSALEALAVRPVTAEQAES
jgi:hypothetical protein